MMKSKLIAAFSFAALVFMAAPARAEEPKTIASIIADSKDHTTLLELVKRAGLTEMLSEKGEWTLFAPTDAAFKKLGAEALARLQSDKDLLQTLLLAQVSKGTQASAEIVKLDGLEIRTLEGRFKVHVHDKLVLIGESLITKTDLKASNGIVHVIDNVLMIK